MKFKLNWIFTLYYTEFDFTYESFSLSVHKYDLFVCSMIIYTQNLALEIPWYSQKTLPKLCNQLMTCIYNDQQQFYGFTNKIKHLIFHQVMFFYGV
jgi:hypothetical protein